MVLGATSRKDFSPRSEGAAFTFAFRSTDIDSALSAEDTACEAWLLTGSTLQCGNQEATQDLLA
jgi:hypothetical protein